MVKVKICGITSPTEARLAERYGADAIGLLVGAGTERAIL
jgi:phosphoribosylanthranilate isomerase